MGSVSLSNVNVYLEKVYMCISFAVLPCICRDLDSHLIPTSRYCKKESRIYNKITDEMELSYIKSRYAFITVQYSATM